jgi:tRNA dimethylallyltransferase
MDSLIAIVGPTAVGKSRLALQLATAFNGEIVSADSRQVYRFMDIGTSKPATEELCRIPHHLIDVVNPDESFSLAQYQELANKAISDIFKRRRQPFLVGGSGQYVWSVLEGWAIPRVPPDTGMRRILEERAGSEGLDKLYDELCAIVPDAARRIDKNNPRRVIRALEIARKGEIAMPENKKDLQFRTLIIGLTAERKKLYRRIDSRVDNMISRGLAGEVKGLINRGCKPELPAMSSIGYAQIADFLQGKGTLDEAVQRIKFESHRYVRQQFNWFRPKDDRIKWFDIQRNMGNIPQLVSEFLSGKE